MNGDPPIENEYQSAMNQLLDERDLLFSENKWLREQLSERIDTLDRLEAAGDKLLPPDFRPQFGDGLTALIDAAAENKRLREILDNAPHDGIRGCSAIHSLYDDDRECDCWKADISPPKPKGGE